MPNAFPTGTRLSVGGGASGQHIPACTEITPDGEIVFELFFDEQDPQVESYRAYRLPYPPTKQRTIGLEVLVGEGNKYEFGQTGVSIGINTLTGDGYNDMTVVRQPYAPVNPEFAGKAPGVVPERVRVTQYGLTSIDAEISFSTASFGLDDPGRLQV